jgi:uncharacterized protein (TIGR02145 family)
MKILFVVFSLMIFSVNGFSQETGIFRDPRDGKVYKTIKIGSQTWFAENLAYKPGSGKYWAYNDDTSHITKYGYLYDWETARRVPPPGWHLSTHAEWTTMLTFLGGADVVGDKLKEFGRTFWKIPSENVIYKNATNESGFSAQPGGYRDVNGQFRELRYRGYWWTNSDDNYVAFAWMHRIAPYINVNQDFYDKHDGLSVRCVKD